MTSDPILLPKIPVAIVIDVPRAEDSHGSVAFDVSTLNIQQAGIRYTESSMDRVLMVGTAMRPLSVVGLGVSAGLQNTSIRSTSSTSAIIGTTNEAGLLVHETNQATADLWFFVYKLGALYQLSDGWKFGVTLAYGVPLKQSEETEVSGNTTTLKSTKSENGTYQASDAKPFHFDLNEGHGYDSLPLKTRIGLSYDFASTWRLSADLQHVVPPKTKSGPKEGVEPIVDLAVGMTNTAWNAVKIYGGLLTLRDSRRRVSQETANRNSGKHIDEYGMTVLAAFSDESSEYALGGYYFRGEGYGRYLNSSEAITLSHFKTSTYQLTASLTTAL